MKRPPLASLRDRWHFRLNHMPPSPERSVLRELLNELDELLLDNLAAGMEKIRGEDPPPDESGSAEEGSVCTCPEGFHLPDRDCEADE